MRVVGPAATHVVATEYRTDGGDHPAATSTPARRIATAAVERGISAAVESDAAAAVSRALDEADGALPVVVSGSFHLLAAVHGATGRQ
jgi:dihydrofolate synthase/folylpolyglutamate synthase